MLSLQRPPHLREHGALLGLGLHAEPLEARRRGARRRGGRRDPRGSAGTPGSLGRRRPGSSPSGRAGLGAPAASVPARRGRRTERGAWRQVETVRKIHSRIGTHCRVDVLPNVSMWSLTRWMLSVSLLGVVGAAEEEVEVEHVLVGRHRLVDDAAHRWRARCDRPEHLVAHVEPQRVDLEAQRCVLAVPDPVEVVVADPLLLVEEGRDRQAGGALAVGPRAVVAVGCGPRSRRRSTRTPARRPRPGRTRAAPGCRSCRARSRRRRPGGSRPGWSRPGAPCPPAPPRRSGAPARRGRGAPERRARATSCGSDRCPDRVAARGRTPASPSGATLPAADAP